MLQNIWFIFRKLETEQFVLKRIKWFCNLRQNIRQAVQFPAVRRVIKGTFIPSSRF